jgi:hypothetical protein
MFASSSSAATPQFRSRPRQASSNSTWPGPFIAYDLLHGLLILKNACITLESRCVSGITANEDVCRGYVER